jgi:adenylate kinase family enzyme
LLTYHLSSSLNGPNSATIQINVIKNNIKQSTSQHILLDGFPRNLDNYYRWYTNNEHNDLGCLVLDCPEEIMITRLLNRNTQNKRTDDIIEIIEERIRVFESETMLVIDKFMECGKCHKVDANNNIDTVFERCVHIIDNIITGAIKIEYMNE